MGGTPFEDRKLSYSGSLCLGGQRCIGLSDSRRGGSLSGSSEHFVDAARPVGGRQGQLVFGHRALARKPTWKEKAHIPDFSMPVGQR